MTDIRTVRMAPDTLDFAGHMRALRKMVEVIGALLMRELHTRYGPANPGRACADAPVDHCKRGVGVTANGRARVCARPRSAP